MQIDITTLKDGIANRVTKIHLMKDNGIFQAVKIALTKAVSTSSYTKKDKERDFLHKSVYLRPVL